MFRSLGSGHKVEYSQGSFQSNIIPLYAFDSLVRDNRLSILELWCNIDRFPFNWGL